MKKYELAKEDYEKGLKYREIADKYGVSVSTVKSWKSRYWSQEKVAIKDATIPNNRGAPDRNKNAIKHGLFANWLPSETLEIMNEVATSKPEEIIWNNIMIQYTAIIRAQKIMYVAYDDSLSKEVSKWSSSDIGSSEEYAIQYAWDKQANFLNAQSRAMGTLSNLIKQFVAIADEQDERRIKLDLMSNQIEKSQLEVCRLKMQTGDLDPEEIDDDGFLAALEAEGEELWPEE
ncbi:phage terminase small subunit [Enterococcus sp. C76]|uniref:phage terminase small subunit n=1 Tax=Enterococcus sp. C76 TaxID=3231334 RepID=UPI00349FE875